MNTKTTRYSLIVGGLAGETRTRTPVHVSDHKYCAAQRARLVKNRENSAQHQKKQSAEFTDRPPPPASQHWVQVAAYERAWPSSDCTHTPQVLPKHAGAGLAFQRLPDKVQNPARSMEIMGLHRTVSDRQARARNVNANGP